MDQRIEKHLRHLIERYPSLDHCLNVLHEAYSLLETAYTNGRKLLVAGNGGSAADSEHIVGDS